MPRTAGAAPRSHSTRPADTCSTRSSAARPSADTVALRDEIAAGAGGFTRLGAAAPPRAEPDRAAPGLPRPLTGLIGRGEELARLDGLLDDPACRLVTLVGPGGIGKTRLAVEVAATRRHRHRDGAVFVSFAGTGPAGPDEAADLVVANLARVLGLSMAVPRDPLDLLADHLSGRELLLVLDNLEHLRDAAGVIDHLLRRAPGTQVLVTSRRRLGLGAEWLVEVPGLPCPPPGAGADGYAAVQLFEERARLLRPGFVTGADLEGTARVCRLVSGVPLAIELAARWVRSARPAAIADRLGRGLELLETTAPDVERRHRSVRAVIDWSWHLLTDEEERALQRLSVFRGGFDLDAAAAVAGAGLPLLAGLVDQSLVTVGEDGRYDMHELLRQYAAERLAADAGRQSRARLRHAEHYAALLPALGRVPRRGSGVPRRRGGQPARGHRAARARGRPGDARRAPAPDLVALPAPGVVPGGAGRPRRGAGPAGRHPAGAGSLAPHARRGTPAARRGGPGAGPPGTGPGPAGLPGAGVGARTTGRVHRGDGDPGPARAATGRPGRAAAASRRRPGTLGDELRDQRGLLGAGRAARRPAEFDPGAQRGRADRGHRPDRAGTGGPGHGPRRGRIPPPRAGGTSAPRARRRSGPATPSPSAGSES
nr:hypothetical protein GCM10020092_063270 [Actinoplanes digitatis]